MNGSGCNVCPAKEECRAQMYRGSMCKDNRAKHGLGDTFTKADRVRVMSDEELADMIIEYGVDEQIKFCLESNECIDALDRGEIVQEERCKQCLIAWLRRPAEVNDNAAD